MEIIECAFEPAKYLIISPEVSPLIYYSHFVAMFAAMAISLLVFLHNPRRLISRLFFLFALIFSVWALLDVILWATNDPGIVMFSWSMQVLAEPTLFALGFYLFYLFLNKKTPPFSLNFFIFLLLLPLIILLPTFLNLEAVYLSSCESEEGPLALYYTYFLNLIFIALIVYTGIRKIPSLNHSDRRSAVYSIVGLTTFLLSFTSGNVISSFTDNWTISQYGLFGMPVFASLIAYSIVQFRIFQIQIAGAQVLVVTLWALVASLLFVKSELQTIIAAITLIFTSIAGFFLIRSVRKEFEQKLELEKLTEQLRKANARLKILDKMKSEFVSIASHQLRSPLTAIRGYVSMLIEGSYGKVPKKAKEALQHISDSGRYMALSIEDYLNVSRIEAGNMKYEISDFNLKDLTEKIVDEIRPAAIKKGLLMVFRSDCDGSCMVHADVGKVRQVIMNLIDNALKYTPKGSITVVAYDNVKKKKMYVSVTDTGVGMSKETIEDACDKFVRAKNANEINVTGTGLGLYVAKKMIEGMNGKIHASSEGEGKGSTFTIELPLLKGKPPQ